MMKARQLLDSETDRRGRKSKANRKNGRSFRDSIGHQRQRGAKNNGCKANRQS